MTSRLWNARRLRYAVSAVVSVGALLTWLYANRLKP